MYRKIALLLLLIVPFACGKKENNNIIFVAQNGSLFPQETTTVELEKGNIYGWQLYTTSDKPVTWKEEFILPETPKFWGDQKATSNKQITEKTTTPKKIQDKYIISNTWSVTDGDPAGNYQFNIYIDNQLVKQFSIVFK